jgi:hypothetical protein
MHGESKGGGRKGKASQPKYMGIELEQGEFQYYAASMRAAKDGKQHVGARPYLLALRLSVLYTEKVNLNLR